MLIFDVCSKHHESMNTIFFEVIDKDLYMKLSLYSK